MNKTTETSFCSRPAALFACGRQSIRLPVPVYIRSSASVVGSREKQGPLGELFDFAGEDDLFGCDTWEDAESSLQRDALHLALQKAGLHSTDIRYLFAGDLLGQSIATSFGLMQYERPLFGLYGACSTCGLSLTLASLAVSGSFADFAACVTSSHFASAEKEFRFPLGYGNQRPLSASWTVTGSGAFILANAPSGHDRAMITGLTPGKIIDYGLRDSMNMGACMAPAAADTIRQHFEDFGTAPNDYDKIVTGDLGKVGQRVLLDLLQTSGIDLGERHMDCGIEIYDCKKQDTHAGGSGCGCSASVLSAFLLKQLSEKKREELFEEITEKAIAYNIFSVDEKRIDEINILNATYEAMNGAVNGLSTAPDFVLIDGNRISGMEIPHETVVKGDSKSISIAAASILAKVSRDKFICQMAEKYPEYGFEKHKGYGTKAHNEAILKYGPCPIHRRTFLRKLLGE